MTDDFRTVICDTADCVNKGILIRVPANGNQVICGGCGAQLAEPADAHH